MRILLSEISKKKEQWLEAKAKTIGGSEAYDAADVDDGAAPLKVWLKLRGQSEPFEGNKLTEFGLKLEPFVAEEAARYYVEKNPGAEVKLIAPDMLYQHDTIDWLTCTPDRHMIINGEVCNLQLKTAHQTQMKYWEEDAGCPARYRAQCLHEGAVDPTISRSFLACFCYVPAFFMVEIPHDPAVIAELIERESKLVKMAQTGELPPIKNVTGSELSQAFWDKKSDNVIQVEKDSEEWHDLWTYFYVCKKFKEAEEAKKNRSADLVSKFGHLKSVITPDGYKMNIIRTPIPQIDMKRFKEDYPLIYKRLTDKYGYFSHSIYPRVWGPKDEE